MALTRINHNIAALNATRNLNRTSDSLGMSLERLSSGLRINRAADDASGLSISEKLRSQISGLNQAIRNAQDAVSLVNTAEGALDETTGLLQRIRELSVKAANTGGLDEQAIQAAQDEIDSAVLEITRIGTDTQFSTRTLLNGSNAVTADVTSGYGASASTGPATSSLEEGTHYLTLTQTSAGSTAITSGSDGSNNANASGVTGSTFDTGSYTISVTNAISAQYNTWATDTFTLQTDGSAAAGASLMTAVDDFGGNLLTVQDDIVITGTSADGSAFAATYNLVAATDLEDIRAWVETTVNAANGASTTDDVTVTILTDGSLQIVEDTVYSGSSFSMGIGVDKGTDGAGTMAGAEYYAAANTQTATARANTAIVSVGGGPAQTVASGQTVAFYGPAPSSSLEPTPEVTMTLGALTDGEDTLTGVQEAWQGSVDGGNNVTFQNGDMEVLFKNGTTAGFASGEFIMLDFAAALTEGTAPISVTNNGLNFHIGANENQRINVGVGDLRASNLGILTTTGQTVADIDVTTVTGANLAIQIVDEAISQVSRQRSSLGAVSNRLEKTINNLGVASENLTASESRIRDADIAYETTRFTRNQILLQAGTAILAQANIAPQSVLQLLG